MIRTFASGAALALALFACSSNDDPGPAGAGGSAGDGGGTGGTGVAPGKAPSLDSAEAAVTGRTGRDLTVTVIARDADRDLDAALLRVLDAAGAEVLAFDADLDGTLDSASTTATLAGNTADADVLATAAVAGLAGRFPEIARVEVKLQDAAGHTSGMKVATVANQPVRSLGEACDASFLRDRCDDGLGCRGKPTTCQEGLAPSITRLAYLRVGDGARVLVEGEEPEGDLASLTIEFQDAKGAPVSVDQDGDGSADGDTFTVDVQGLSDDGGFFYGVEPGGSFVELVARLVVTPADRAGHVGARATAAVAPLPVRKVGQSCDPRGFDTCAEGFVCSPGIVGERSACKAPVALRPLMCDAAPVIDPFEGPSTASGLAEGSGAWDPPLGCAAQEPHARPEGLVRLRLSRPAAELTVTSAVPGTTYDTILYVVKDCTEEALACNDDSDGAASSTVTLTSVPAGDYLIVVDSWDPGGGRFAVLATAK